MTSRRSAGGWVRIAFAAFMAISLGACARPADVSVSQLEALFPTIERLGVKIYLVEPWDQAPCEYLQYSGGSYRSLEDDVRCLITPSDGTQAPKLSPFDEEARGAWADLRHSFEEQRLPMRAIFVELDADNRITTGSFAADRCVTYHYRPGWSELPDNDQRSTYTALDSNWFKVDDCGGHL